MTIPIHPSVNALAAQYGEAFQSAHPFRHIAIDNFFEESFAERLLAEFPSFDRKRAIAESGEVGGKSVNTEIAAISPAWQEAYAVIGSKEFLDLISSLSGIPDLIMDPAMFGGGTHENLNGQELDPHVDFNYDEAEKLHRRLNLIVYLNHGWRSEWGGAIEIHSNPRRPDENRIQAFAPLFNRAVMFETNEYSWHGFPKIDLPEPERHRSRKCFSIYLYTKDRPAEEIAPRHATFYVQRPLPERYRAGYTLTAEDQDELTRLLARRDRWIELYQQAELQTSREIANYRRTLDQLPNSRRVPLTGYVTQEGPVTGYHSDQWVGPKLHLRIAPIEPVIKLAIKGYRPEGLAPGKVRILVNGVEVGGGGVEPGRFSVSARLPVAQSDPFDVEISFEGPAAVNDPAVDNRDLAFILLELRAIHLVGLDLRMRRD